MAYICNSRSFDSNKKALSDSLALVTGVSPEKIMNQLIKARKQKTGIGQWQKTFRIQNICDIKASPFLIKVLTVGV